MLVPLKENAVFRRLYYMGASAGHRYLAVYCRRNRLEHNRVGLTVSAKLGNAVTRNRIRRRLREIYRAQESGLKCGWDLVIVARGAAVDAEFAVLARAFAALTARLELTK